MKSLGYTNSGLLWIFICIHSGYGKQPNNIFPNLATGENRILRDSASQPTSNTAAINTTFNNSEDLTTAFYNLSETTPNQGKDELVIDDIISRATSRDQQQKTTTKPTIVKPVERNLSDEESLMQFLLKQYNPSARPVLKGSDTVNVDMQFSLMHIKDLDVKSQILTTTGLLILEWKDERLTWDPRQHNDLEEIIIEIEMLWKPEFAVINGAENIYEEYNQFRAVVKSNGTVHWEPGGVFKTMCEIDITYYPFDDQMCNLKFGAWTYHTGKMNMTNMMDIVNNDSYSENGEWTITVTKVNRGEFTYNQAPLEPFAYIDFMIFLRRRHTFYILNVILPSIMTSVLLLSVFFCTPAQKVQIGVVVLLSFRIFLLNVADNIPKTSDHIPLLGIYLTCTMAITTLSMVLTVFVLNLHHISERPVPSWARSVLFTGLARIMGMCSTADALSQKPHNHNQFHQTFMNNVYSRPSATTETDCIEEKAAMMHEMQSKSNTTTNSENIEGSPMLHHSGNISPVQQEMYLRKLQLLKEEEKIQEQNKAEKYAKDWKRVAEIFDRLFFWLFLFAIVLSTLVLFHPLTKEQRFNTIKMPGT